MNDRKKVGVVGAGVMGRGIVQLFAQSGFDVLVYDSFEGAVPKAVAAVSAMFDKLAAKGRMDADQAAASKSAVRGCEHLQELSQCDVVIEAIIEDVPAKQALFAELEGILAKDAILASNTSSLVVAEIAAGCQHPERVAGLHFFNPVPLMKVVEIIGAVRTDARVVGTLRELVEATGHRAVIAADQPGFLVNHAGRGYSTEALRVIEEQVADIWQVDALMREAAGFRMGPFELMDLTGLDVSGKAMESIYQQFHQEPRFRPSSLVAPRMAAGLFGRKTGAGWYRYDEGGQQLKPDATTERPALRPGLKVWIDPEASGAAALSQLADHAGCQVSAPGDADLCLIQPWGEDASCASQRLQLDASRTVAVDPLPDPGVHRTAMLTAITSPEARDQARAVLGSDGVAVTVIGDSPGYVVTRILATIVNIACNIAQRGIASVADIEDAVQLGLGYPRGPLAWGDAIGGDRVLQILQNMHRQTGDPRYRPSLWLVRRVQLGRSLTEPEARR